MKALLLWIGLGLIAPAMLVAATPAPDLAANPPAEFGRPDASRPTIFIAGDSTSARNGAEDIEGWGVPFAAFFDLEKVNIANRARGGRSSRTFITEGLWDGLLAEVKAGDIVLIQFGHNDGGAINAEPPGSTRPLRARGSLPGVGEESEAIDNVLTGRPEVVRTFGWYLRRMVADVRSKAATPILLSPTVRNLWPEGKVERGPGHFRGWTRLVAEQTGAPFADVSRILADRYQELGQDGVGEFFTRDHTHTNPAGARFTAAAVVAGLKGLRPEPGFTDLLSAAGAALEPDAIGWLNLPEPAAPVLPSLFLIGDSTVRNGRGDGEGGQWGWGDELPLWLATEKINIVNRAIGGLSSRTFLTQGHWQRVLTLLKPGDFVLMQFGHNDSGPLNDTTRARGTIKGTGGERETIDNLLTGRRETVHTYGWYLRHYIREARAYGAWPVVCSPVPRKRWENGKIVRSQNGYGDWARQVAAEEGAAFIDLGELVATRYDELGPEAVDAMFGDAHTHTSLAGARLGAAVVATALAKMPDDPLRDYLRPTAYSPQVTAD